MRRYFYLLLMVASCNHLKQIKPTDAFAGYRVAVYDLGKSLEDYKRNSDTEVLKEFDTLLQKCRPQDKLCESEVSQVVKDKFKTRQENFNKAQVIHKRAVETAHVVDVLCQPGDSETCTKSIEEALKNLPEIIARIKEFNLWKLCWPPYSPSPWISYFRK